MKIRARRGTGRPILVDAAIALLLVGASVGLLPAITALEAGPPSLKEVRAALPHFKRLRTRVYEAPSIGSVKVFRGEVRVPRGPTVHFALLAGPGADKAPALLDRPVIPGIPNETSITLDSGDRSLMLYDDVARWSTAPYSRRTRESAADISNALLIKIGEKLG